MRLAKAAWRYVRCQDMVDASARSQKLLEASCWSKKNLWHWAHLMGCVWPRGVWRARI
jgi:hypothetical protein